MHLEANIFNAAYFKMARWMALIMLIVLIADVRAQVANNNISGLSVLELDSTALESNTKNSTVEWKCINKALTSKCLVYHNDQWFSFSVAQSGQYYINISDQHCSDNRGLQALIIEGNPCTTASYKILQCISKINQDDTFITLDPLVKDKRYLLNIDGFLADACSFKIQLSSAPTGLPLHDDLSEPFAVSSVEKNNVVTLQWTAGEAFLSTTKGFEVWRKQITDTKFMLLDKIPLHEFAYGAALNHYELTDTLRHDGTYQYKIMATTSDGKRELIGQKQMVINTVSLYKNNAIRLSLRYKHGTPLQILIIDDLKDVVLKKTSFGFNEETDGALKILTEPYYKAGINKIMIRVVNLRTKQATLYHYLLSAEGAILQQ